MLWLSKSCLTTLLWLLWLALLPLQWKSLPTLFPAAPAEEELHGYAVAVPDSTAVEKLSGHLVVAAVADPVAIVEELPGHLVVAAVAELFPTAVSSVCFAAGSFAERVAAAGLALGQVVYPFAKPIGSCSHQSWVQFLWL